MSIVDKKLPLSEAERFKLYNYSKQCFEEYKQTSEDDCWYGFQFRNRHFDIQIFDDVLDGREVTYCTVYECFQSLDGIEKGYWSTCTDRSQQLWGIPK